MIAFACPNCNKTLKAPPERAGSKATCPACRHTVVVPAAGEPILEVLPVEDEPAPKKGPPPLPPVARPVAVPDAPSPDSRKHPPRPEPSLRDSRRWENVASILGHEDESERAVEVAGPVLDEVRRRLDQYAAGVPHHHVGRFGSKATVLSLTECCLFSASLKAVYETRRLGQGEAPYLGWKIPAREFMTEGLDLWDFRYPCGPGVSGRSEHVIPSSQKTSRCDQCTGQGGVACPTCRGGRVVACQKCGGGGTEACGRCGGDGIVYVSGGVQQRWVNCTTCNGTGQWFPPSYGPADGRCPRCAGKGVVPKDEEVSQPVPCTCRTGRIACSGCRGQKQVACRACTGTGRMQCGRCRGDRELVRYASVIRTLEPASQTLTVPGDGCDKQIVDLLSRRTRFLPLLRITARDLPGKPLDGPDEHRLTAKVNDMLDAIRSEATAERRVACIELEVYRTVALKAEYEFNGCRYDAWMLGKEKVVHAPTSPVTQALCGKLTQAAKQWRQQQKKEAVALLREAIEMGQKDGYCQAALNASKGDVPSDLWEAATNPGVFESIKNFFGNLFG
jgi:hypothetical protein